MTRRFIFSTVVCLVVGLSISIAIALGAAIFPPSKIESRGLGRGELPFVLIDLYQHRTAERYSICYLAFFSGFALDWEGDLPQWTLMNEDELRRFRYGSPRIESIASGFPMRCLRGSVIHPEQQLGEPESVARAGAWWLSLGDDPDSGRVIPLTPIWPGLIANTLTFAMPVWGICFILPTARCKRRQRRGHCPKCNYDLLADFDSGCPECGWGRSSPTPDPANTIPSQSQPSHLRVPSSPSS